MNNIATEIIIFKVFVNKIWDSIDSLDEVRVKIEAGSESWLAKSISAVTFGCVLCGLQDVMYAVKKSNPARPIAYCYVYPRWHSRAYTLEALAAMHNECSTNTAPLPNLVPFLVAKTAIMTP